MLVIERWTENHTRATDLPRTPFGRVLIKRGQTTGETVRAELGGAAGGEGRRVHNRSGEGIYAE